MATEPSGGNMKTSVRVRVIDRRCQTCGAGRGKECNPRAGPLVGYRYHNARLNAAASAGFKALGGELEDCACLTCDNKPTC